MLPFALVLLVASSAFAAPSVSVSQYSINDIAPATDNGAVMSSFVTDRAFELVDGADSNIYILTIQQILNDLADQQDPYAKATAMAQTIAILGELANGVPGDACVAAAVVDSYASGRGNGNAISAYLNHIARNLDIISTLAINSNSLRYSVGPRANCPGGGRTYQFEAAWNAILDRTSPYNMPLVNEEYCAAKRLYSAFNVRSNNVGAHVTAASVPAVVKAVQKAMGPLSNFFKIVVSGGNASAAASVAKNALFA